MAARDEVLLDLEAEGADVDLLVSGIEPERWRSLTPSPGWTIAHQIGHLAASDRFAALAVTDPDAFAAQRAGIADGLDETNDASAADAAVLPPGDLLAEVQYDCVFGFKYSARPNTPALVMIDSIAEAEKAQRLQSLLDRQREIQREHYGRHLGQPPCRRAGACSGSSRRCRQRPWRAPG